ncbi:DUF4309 domain-containing protein [Paenibacillus puerhi]|uniref:DUF4309 domain-containing protein n=1 Tax=Paenibacillus puerhi TaxID=2692622 RepID=UPI00135B2098|nr:DUF4309 domain-containing protein [Paenibacillus puerhi]
MKKRMFTLGLVAGITLASASSVYAADRIKAYLYPVKLVLNGEETKIPGGMDIINYSNNELPLKEGKLKPVISDDFISIATQGKINGIDIPLGMSKEDVIKNLGEPDEIGKEHTEYLKYSATKFFIHDNSVLSIETELPLSLSPKEIKDKLGHPDADEMSDIGPSEYLVGYRTGDYYLYFKFKTNGLQTKTLLLKKFP